MNYPVRYHCSNGIVEVECRCSRREFIVASAGAFAWCLGVAPPAVAKEVRDIHSQLARATPSRELFPNSLKAARIELDEIAKVSDGHLAMCGARHSAGGQAFADKAPLLDTTWLNNVVAYDAEAGTITVQAGIQWPAIIDWLKIQNSEWTFRQKQTGNDSLTLGGTLSSNAHGQGLRFKPIIGDVQSFRLTDANGKDMLCSRTDNADLFKLGIGGYGNFGLITEVTLQLTRRVKHRRHVQLAEIREIPQKYRTAVATGARYGDFQCNIDDTSPNFLREGVWKEYQAVADEVPLTSIRSLTPQEWVNLVVLAHTNKTLAWKQFSEGLLTTDGAVQYNEFWQGSPYVNDYHRTVDRATHSRARASEVLTELYVPLDDIANFMEDARKLIVDQKINMVYSTIRFIEKDDESFLPWARTLSACIIFNIHTEHNANGIARTQKVCQGLIDAAIKYGGSYYLTYHRYARKDQITKCYPEFVSFLRAKRQLDPKRLFRSDWYSFYERMFFTELG